MLHRVMLRFGPLSGRTPTFLIALKGPYTTLDSNIGSESSSDGGAQDPPNHPQTHIVPSTSGKSAT